MTLDTKKLGQIRVEVIDQIEAYYNSAHPAKPYTYSTRKIGTTTRQLKEAARHALFIWCNDSSLHYARQLATSLGRHDLQIEGPDSLKPERCHKLFGTTYPAVILDHAFSPTSEQWQVVNEVARATTCYDTPAAPSLSAIAAAKTSCKYGSNTWEGLLTEAFRSAIERCWPGPALPTGFLGSLAHQVAASVASYARQVGKHGGDLRFTPEGELEKIDTSTFLQEMIDRLKAPSLDAVFLETSKIVLEPKRAPNPTPKLDVVWEGMKSAPKGALIVWDKEDLTEVRARIETIKRPDLVLRPRSCLNDIDQFYGLKFSDILLYGSANEEETKHFNALRAEYLAAN